jgi:phage-related protein
VNSFACVYYLTDSGKSPVEEFIKSLNQRTRQKFFACVSLLEEYGKGLPGPHAKYIGNGIYELRVRGQEGHIRVLYFFFQRKEIIFTNGFIKKTNKVPKKEKDLAELRKQSYLERTEDDD